MLDAAMRDRLEAALRVHDLKGVVERLRSGGLTQVAIYVLFEELYSELGGSGRVEDADEVGGRSTASGAIAVAARCGSTTCLPMRSCRRTERTARC